MLHRNEALALLIRRLRASSELSEADCSILADIPFDLRDYPARARIFEIGERNDTCFLILDGITSRYQLTPDGEHQIHAVQIKGELPDLLGLHLGHMDHSIRTLSPCRLAFIDHRHLWDVCNRSPAINAAFWRETLIDAAIYRASNLRIGRFSATARVAHLLCEMKLRFEAVDAVRKDRYVLDMTQQEIGDLLALSFVSVNRALRELREERLAVIDRRTVEIFDWDGLVERGGFDPIYLHRGKPA